MLEKEEKINRKLLELAEKLSLKDAVIQTSLDGRITSWSLGAEKLYGYAESEVKGLYLVNLLVSKEHANNLQANNLPEGSNLFEAVHVTKDGKVIKVLLNIAIVKDAKGNVIGNSIISRDTTERHWGAPLPANEAERLEALQQYKILDTPAEDNFDDLTKLASYVCETQIALISLVDAERQWFKSKVGLEVSETPRNQAFCGYTILQDSLFEIEDAIADDRFFDHPLVTKDPQIRFYAGIPLITNSGSAIGSLCVIDNAPKKLNEKQIEMLKILSRMVMRELEFRKKR